MAAAIQPRFCRIPVHAGIDQLQLFPGSGLAEQGTFNKSPVVLLSAINYRRLESWEPALIGQQNIVTILSAVFGKGFWC